MKLICVDVERSWPAIPPCRQGEQWVLLRLHGSPIGFVVPPVDGCGSDELRRLAIERHGWSITTHLLGDRLQGSPDVEAVSCLRRPCPRWQRAPRTSVTVAVCTRNHASQLGSCLEALDRLAYPPALLDIVIVDNAPVDDSTRALVGRYPRMRYICEPRPGLDWARNCAARAARGNIVAYTDDDVLVDANWVTALAAAFDEEPHAMCVTGLVVPEELDTRAQILFEQYGGFGRGFNRHVYRVPRGESAARLHGGTGRFGTGANMAFRRAFFERQGLFDPALDVGTPSNGGGDLEMFFRVLKTGHALVYEPAAMVRHRHRRDYAALKTQIANNGIGFFAYLVRTAQSYPDERLAVVRLGLWWLWWWNVRRVAKSLLRPGSFPLDLVTAELKGSFVGLRRYADSRRHAAEVLERFGAPGEALADTA